MTNLQVGYKLETKTGKHFEIIHIYEEDVLIPGKNEMPELIIHKGDILAVNLLNNKTVILPLMDMLD